MEIQIRASRPGDGEGLARAWVDAARYYEEIDPDRFQVPEAGGLVASFEESMRVAASDDFCGLVAELGGRVVGWITARVLPPMENARWQLLRELGETRVVIDALVVEARYRRRGIGTALMNAVEDWARSKGAVLASVDTYVDSPISVPFYERRMGYTRIQLSFRKRLG